MIVGRASAATGLCGSMTICAALDSNGDINTWRHAMERREFLTVTGLAVGTLCPGESATSADRDRAVSITVRADKPQGNFNPIWRFFGADEPNYAYMKDGK